MDSLVLRNIRLNRLVGQRCRRELVLLRDELIVGWDDESECKGHDAGEQYRGCDIEFEGCGTGILCWLGWLVV